MSKEYTKLVVRLRKSVDGYMNNAAAAAIETLQAQLTALRKIQCPPLQEQENFTIRSIGDCICPIAELEGLLQQMVWIAEKRTDLDDSEETTLELARQALP